MPTETAAQLREHIAQLEAIRAHPHSPEEAYAATTTLATLRERLRTLETLTVTAHPQSTVHKGETRP